MESDFAIVSVVYGRTNQRDDLLHGSDSELTICIVSSIQAVQKFVSSWSRWYKKTDLSLSNSIDNVPASAMLDCAEKIKGVYSQFPTFFIQRRFEYSQYQSPRCRS